MKLFPVIRIAAAAFALAASPVSAQSITMASTTSTEQSGLFGYLLPEFKHLDFLWLLKGDVVADENLQQLMSSIRGVPGVQMVMELAHEKIRNKGHLIF